MQVCEFRSFFFSFQKTVAKEDYAFQIFPKGQDDKQNKGGCKLQWGDCKIS